jgi:hypothetical protein
MKRHLVMLAAVVAPTLLSAPAHAFHAVDEWLATPIEDPQTGVVTMAAASTDYQPVMVSVNCKAGVFFIAVGATVPNLIVADHERSVRVDYRVDNGEVRGQRWSMIGQEAIMIDPIARALAEQMMAGNSLVVRLGEELTNEISLAGSRAAISEVLRYCDQE